MDISKIIIDDRNKYFGIYKDEKNKENFYCIIDTDSKDSVLLINLFAGYYFKVNIVNRLYIKYNINKDVLLEPHNINACLKNSTGEQTQRNVLQLDNNIIELVLSQTNIIYNKFTKQTNFEYLKNSDITAVNPIIVTKGGTRQVYLLDNVVIKETDPTCSLQCEQMTNYYALLHGIHIVKLIGLIKHNNIDMIVEEKHIPIDWSVCLTNISEYNKYNILFKKLVENITMDTVLGDFNLSNILKDKNGDKLIITDYNAKSPALFLDSRMILNLPYAKDFKNRLADCLTDERLVHKIHIAKFSDKYGFQLILKKIFENYDKVLENSQQLGGSYKHKYLKYKNKYINSTK